MKRFILSLLLLATAAGIVVQSSDKPQAGAAPVIDHSAELAAKDARIAELSEQLTAAIETRAAQAVQPDASAAQHDAGTAAGVLKHDASFVTPPLARSQSCASGACNQPAMQPRQYSVPRPFASQPVRRLRGRVFTNAPWNR